MVDASPVFGRNVADRVRPTYDTSVLGRWGSRESFPKSNSRRVGPAVTVHWRIRPWRGLDDFYTHIQQRAVQAAVFEGDRLVCGFRVLQTRNASEEWMPWDEYLMCCDDISAEQGLAAVQLQEVSLLFLDDDFMGPGASTAEVTDLTVAQAYLGTKYWAPAIRTVLRRLARTCESEALLCVLQPFPLEWSWHSDQVQAERRAPTEKELELKARRTRALERLYRRELGFELLDTGWMGMALDTAER